LLAAPKTRLRTGGWNDSSKERFQVRAFHRLLLSLRNSAALLGLSVLSWLPGLALTTPTAQAGNILYTWVEDDSLKYSGSLLVKGSAQAAGQITASDIISFTFTTPNSSYDKSDILTEFLPIPISTTNAGFTAEFKAIGAVYLAGGKAHDLSVSVNSKYAEISGEAVSDKVGHNPPVRGAGHWVITFVVPEPSSLVLSITACVGGAGLATIRKRRRARE
jgi:hypothetical protein